MRQHVSALLWIAGTTAVVAAAQVVTTKAAAERRAVTVLNIALVDNTVRIRELEAELRTRAGLPVLQRWNDEVFQMSAPQSGQILRSPVQLAAFAAPAGGPPSVQFTVARDPAAPGATAPLPPAGAPAAPTPATAGATLVRTSFGAPAAPSAPPVPVPDIIDEPQGG